MIGRPAAKRPIPGTLGGELLPLTFLSDKGHESQWFWRKAGPETLSLWMGGCLEVGEKEPNFGALQVFSSQVHPA